MIQQLTKPQQALLARLASNPHGVWVTGQRHVCALALIRYGLAARTPDGPVVITAAGQARLCWDHAEKAVAS